MPRVVSRHPAVTVGRPRFTPIPRSGAPLAVVSGDPRRTAVLEVKARRRTPAGETPAPLRRGQRPAVVDRRSLEGRASSRPQLPPTLAPLQLAAAESRTASGSRPVAGRGPTKGDGAPRSFRSRETERAGRLHRLGPEGGIPKRQASRPTTTGGGVKIRPTNSACSLRAGCVTLAR